MVLKKGDVDMKVEFKKMTMKKAMSFVLLFSVTTMISAISFSQEAEELRDETITQEVDQELTTFGQNPNSKTHSSSSVKKVTKTSKIQSTPVVVSSSTPMVVSSTAPVATAQNKKTVVTTKTINELPVKVPVKITTVKTTTTIPKAKTTVQKSSVIKSTTVGTKSVVPAVGGVQKQPVTFVEASPLSESRGDEIRRRRQDEEMRTESKIVEKLEQSRMEDERRRAEALFGDRLDAKPVQDVVIEQETTAIEQEVESAPLMLEQTTTESQTDISEFQKEPAFFDSKYVGLTAGVPTYPDYSNIKGDYNVGIKFGMAHDRFLFEMGISMAQFVLEDSYYGFGPNSAAGQSNYVYGYSSNGQIIGTRADFELKQYSGSLGSRYQILDGFVRPNVGGEFIYSYRQYSSLERTLEINSFGAATVLPEGTNYGNSHALDFGVLAGVDLVLNPSFTIGADFKYLINVAHRINGENSTSGTPIEKLQYFVGGLSAVFTF